MSQTVIGIFDSSREAQDAVDQLTSNGFSRSSIDISAQGADTSYTNSSRDKDKDDDSIGGFFKSLFGSDNDESDKYSRVASRGTVVTVHAQSSMEAQRAAQILDQYGAVDVDDRITQYERGGYTGTSTTGSIGAYTTTDRTDIDRGDVGTTNSIPIIEENLQVGKREVTTGGVRLRSRIIERPVEESLRLRSEHVHIERNPVNRPASTADLNNFKEGTIELTEHAEVPIVNKEARVVEEINLSKDVEERVETIRDTVRSTDVDIEKITGDDRIDTDRIDTNRRYDTDRDSDLNRPAGL